MMLFEGVRVMLSRFSKLAGAAGVVALFAAAPAFAQEAAAAASPAAPFTPTAEMVNKGDTAWMLVSSALVLMMSIPALALFYGGLVRSKNMRSVLMPASRRWSGLAGVIASPSQGAPHTSVACQRHF
jgi:hypothetical protein